MRCSMQDVFIWSNFVYNKELLDIEAINRFPDVFIHFYVLRFLTSHVTYAVNILICYQHDNYVIYFDAL